MNEFEYDILLAADTVKHENPGADFPRWCELLMRQYPAEVVDALGADERTVEVRLKNLWRKISSVERN